jgi:opacity protein-like surface antigen
MRLSYIIISVLVFFGSTPAFSAIHFGLSGSAATSHLGLETHKTQSGKASVAVDLGSYFRLSLGAMRQIQNESGYKNFTDDDNAEAIPYKATTAQNVYSLDFIAVLYAGEIFTPYLFVGAAFKNYEISVSSEGGPNESTQFSFGPVPQYGAGLAVALSKDFSLKLTYTMSDGVVKDPAKPEEDPGRRVSDTRVDIGISYKLE